MVVFTIGIPRSASTWMYNLVLALLERQTSSVDGHYVDVPNSLAALISDRNEREIAIKTHVGTHDFWETVPTDAHFIITTRDVRDGIASSRHMFQSVSFQRAIQYSRAAADFSMRAANQQNALVFRYEDKFFEQLSTVIAVAEQLGVPVRTSDAEDILDQLSRENVLKRIKKLQMDGVIGDDADSASHDPRTHWHPGHLKDGRVGKYIDILSQDEIDLVTESFKDYSYHFYGNYLPY